MNNTNEDLPLGRSNLDASVTEDKANKRFKCVAKGCQQWLRPPERKDHRGDVCPEHGIRVHKGKTYSYADYRRNLIVDADYFDQHIRGHEFKYESHRFGQERSEDAVTWNVFRSFQRAGLLHTVASLCTGMNHPQEPRLFLWGLELKPDDIEPWDLLIKARVRFESDLPVSRPKTEPDIGLHLPGCYLLLIEAKFTSPNGTYVRDRKTKLFDLTIDQLVQIYQDKSHRILNYPEAKRREQIHYQLWRNMTFAEEMARTEGPNTRAFHANLVRAGCEEGTCDEFVSLIHPEFQDRFEQITWEGIYTIANQHRDKLDRVCRYLENKTEGLKPAFKIVSPSNQKESIMEHDKLSSDKPTKRSTLGDRMNDVSGMTYIPPEVFDEMQRKKKEEAEKQKNDKPKQ